MKGFLKLSIWTNCLIVGAGGMIGSIGRYLLSLVPLKAQSGFPVNTLLINVIGAFCLGAIVAFSEKNANLNPQLLLFLKIGICGGFTTFSTFSGEAVQLLQNGKFIVALSYMVLSIVLCVSAVIGAQALIK